ncbi:UNVERIFIED_CONTAM: hypothetical protein Slati_3685000 [Sesamum latifolium]|uniref:Transposase-associated domain-containing protein n=1 Tax=Sesamum latifolium TaxID=2727402 RepID=A0AAW2U1S1_9LAMI
MYEKNLPRREGLTSEFEDGVTAFIEWAKFEHAYMDDEKIKCPCRKSKSEVFKTSDKLIRDLGLPVEKIDACKNGCILYWKNDIDLDYCKFCGGARYKPTRERNTNYKKTPYAILRYLPLTSRLQRLYASEATAEQMTWHANH